MLGGNLPNREQKAAGFSDNKAVNSRLA